jgi:RNA polymerase-interacting CarD/CdnL/TRCF family regulator
MIKKGTSSIHKGSGFVQQEDFERGCTKMKRTPNHEYFVTTKRYLSAIEHPMVTAIERNQRYGNSIDVMRDGSIIDLMLMKLIRTRQLSNTDLKFYDEIEDVLNYAVYLLIRKQDNFIKAFLQLKRRKT